MTEIKTVLAIESSCDDTSVAIVKDDGYVVNQISANQDLAHAPFGGVVPEIASRNHSVSLLPLIDHVLQKSQLTWRDINGLVVTNRPGLIGSLIVGIVTVKAIAQSYKIPMIGINHLEGHLLAPFLKDDSYQPPQHFSYPYVALAVSGGHTSLYWVEDFGRYTVIGTTKDDAAGEAFDKFAKMLNLGFPGGALVDKFSAGADFKKYNFPRSLIAEDNLMMSFSGLKSSAARLIEKLSAEEIENQKADLCASFQEAIVDVLIHKLEKAAALYNCKKIIITGGVSANSRLRERAEALALRKKMVLVIPPIRYCTDNAAMIGYTGLLRLRRGERDQMDMGPFAESLEKDFSYAPSLVKQPGSKI